MEEASDGGGSYIMERSGMEAHTVLKGNSRWYSPWLGVTLEFPCTRRNFLEVFAVAKILEATKIVPHGDKALIWVEELPEDIDGSRGRTFSGKGVLKESYVLLARCGEALKIANLGTHYDLKVDLNGHFRTRNKKEIIRILKHEFGHVCSRRVKISEELGSISIENPDVLIVTQPRSPNRRHLLHHRSKPAIEEFICCIVRPLFKSFGLLRRCRLHSSATLISRPFCKPRMCGHVSHVMHADASSAALFSASSSPSVTSLRLVVVDELHRLSIISQVEHPSIAKLHSSVVGAALARTVLVSRSPYVRLKPSIPSRPFANQAKQIFSFNRVISLLSRATYLSSTEPPSQFFP
ncbi:uncharacterized protein E5676_scaffold14G00340 [Cucumis melo var. makuwa]|uniref:Uncharacterized protein n=1 Tax=Cucumis melo var. makuwa TaxID=1194695 RepID=A0A5A7VMY8_CUCMM|nr:uncharacterized protein E6C27_scaffold38G00710 [Cucumis melo var. makuwa]TYK26267.1 uncharacterized protein E5676_scaffold14G00340 [Cucumis melo var. makuwa]